MASTTMMAFSKAGRVRMSRGLMSRTKRLLRTRPASRAASSLRRSTAGMDAAPGIDIPRASIAEAMVLAVNIPAQAPSPGQATRSIASRSSRLIWPRAWRPTASYMSCMFTSSPLKLPGSIAPP